MGQFAAHAERQYQRNAFAQIGTNRMSIHSGAMDTVHTQRSEPQYSEVPIASTI